MEQCSLNSESKRILIAAIRKIALAGITLLAVWLILYALRGTIEAKVIDALSLSMHTDSDPGLSYDLSDWTKSWRTGESVYVNISRDLGITLRNIALIGIVSLASTGVLLFIGALVSLKTKKRAWLDKLRSILRLLLVSCGAAIPVFLIGTIIAFLEIKYQSFPPHPIPLFWSTFFCSMPLTWMLVQTGHETLINQTEKSPRSTRMRHLVFKLLTRILKLIGFIIVIVIFEEQLITYHGLGRQLIDNLQNLDFPLAVGIIWIFVIILVMTKLAAELSEIVHSYYTRQTVLLEPVAEKPVIKQVIPQGWLIFCLGLLAFIILVAVVGPLLTPYATNQIDLLIRLKPPSAGHLLGTDQLGRDILSQLLNGIRTDTLTGVACAGAVCLIAGGWAMLVTKFKKMNNWLGDSLEDIVLLPKDIVCSLPWLVLLLFMVTLMRIYFFGGAILNSAFYIAFIAGLVILPRAVGMIQKTCHYMAEGNNYAQRTLRSMPIVFVFTAAGVVIYISAMSYLGFGVSPVIPELGQMLGTPVEYLVITLWLILGPAICLTLILTVWVITGEALLERLGFRSRAIWSKTME